MGLSPRARTMLAESTRYSCPRDRVEIIAGIERAHLPVFDVIVRFQETFGGIAYRVPGTELGLHLGIMPKATSGVEGFEEEGRYFFSCGCSPALQFSFYMDQGGIVYAYPNVLYPIASSIEKYIESHALMYEMYRHAKSPLLPVGWRMAEEGVFDRNDRRPDARVQLPIIPEASDLYTTWWGGTSIQIERTVYQDWDTGQRDVVRAFARSWKDVFAVRRLFAEIDFTYPNPHEGVPIADSPDLEPMVDQREANLGV